MQLTGQWSPEMDRLSRHLGEMGSRFENVFGEVHRGDVTDAVVALYNNLSAISGTILKMCKDMQTPCSSQAFGALLRMLIDSVVSVFAFCHDPARRARMFLDYRLVLRFRGQVFTARHIGCPLMPSRRYDQGKMARELASTKQALLHVGKEYLKKAKPRSGQTPDDVLANATRAGTEKPALFRDHWWPERNRSEVLAYERMEWVDDVLYRWLCSDVHSDARAGLNLSGLDRNSAASFSLQFWAASVFRLSQALGLTLPQDDFELLRDQFYAPLQWP